VREAAGDRGAEDRDGWTAFGAGVLCERPSAVAPDSARLLRPKADTVSSEPIKITTAIKTKCCL